MTRWTFVGKVMSLLFNMLFRLVITFLPRSKHLLISWLQSPSTVILEPRKIKSDTVSTVSPSIFHEVMGPDAMILVFWMLSFKPIFSLSSFTFIKWTLNVIPSVLKRGRQKRRRWFGKSSREGRDVNISPVMPAAIKSWKSQLIESLMEPPERIGPADTDFNPTKLILDLRLPEL